MKLHLLVFKLLIVLIPTQLAFHLWPNWAFIFGRRIDYLSPAVYLTDLFIFATIGLWILYLLKSGKSKINKPTFHKKYFLLALLILSIIALNIVSSTLPVLTFYKWVRVGEYIALAVYIHNNKKVIKQEISFFVSIAILWTSVLSLMQFLNGGTIGGLWYWLGERSFTENTPGIALQVIQGQSFLRPYATFPHPNALAGGLVVLIALSIFNMREATNKLFLKIAIILSFGVFLLARSESALLALIVSLVSILFSRSMSVFRLILISGFISLLMLSYAPSIGRNVFSSSISERIVLLTNAGRVISESPFVGVGLGSSVLLAPRTLLQPVHNIFVLLWEEIGGIGLFAIGIALYQLRHKISRSWQLLFFVSVVTTIGLFDHYWLTLHQPMLLLAIVFGLYGVDDETISTRRGETKVLIQVRDSARRKSKRIHSSIK